jgi:hypothetical protein
LVTMELDVYEARIESPKGNHQNGEFYFSWVTLALDTEAPCLALLIVIYIRSQFE